VKTVQITLPAALVEAIAGDAPDPSAQVARLLALHLFRQHKVSLGRAAELCETPIAAFMVFAGERGVPLHYGASDLEEDRLTLERFGHH
jgi:predicted HTH domain antitoxin